MNSHKTLPEVSLISHDLRQDEVCLRAIQTFEFLDKLIDEVFDKLDGRVEQNRQRISNYHERIDRASATIERLRDSKKAIKFSVPTKYPVPGPPTYTPLFSDGFKTKLEFTYNLQGALPVPETKKPSDKLEFFHLKKAKPEKRSKKQNIAFKVKSINSLITFINNENLIYHDPMSPKSKYSEYRDYIPMPAEDEDDTDFSRLTKALKQTSRVDNESFHYFPNMSQAPDIELPMDLPDLAGIAGDIMFSDSDQELIAPSMARMSILNDLPNVEDLMAESNKKSRESVVDAVKTASNDVVIPPPPIPSGVSIPPPPPPPSIPIELPKPSSIPPPPPPVPAAAMMSSGGPSKTENVPKAPQPDDMRSSLMAAIRGAAGRKLKSVAAREEVDRTAATKKPLPKPAGDLMSDLHAKLAMRRRGIAGSKEAKKEKASLMDKVSKMIPPPVSDGSSDDDDGSNSNDTDDWE